MWRYEKPYMTFKYDEAGNLDPVMLHDATTMTYEETRGVLSVKQIDELYSLPHDMDDPATMEVHVNGCAYRVVRSDAFRCRTKDTGRVSRTTPSRKVGWRFYEDVDREYVYAYPWYGPFPKGQVSGTAPVAGPEKATASNGNCVFEISIGRFHDKGNADAYGIRNACHGVGKTGKPDGFKWNASYTTYNNDWVASHPGPCPSAPLPHNEHLSRL